MKTNYRSIPYQVDSSQSMERETVTEYMSLTTDYMATHSVNFYRPGEIIHLVASIGPFACLRTVIRKRPQSRAVCSGRGLLIFFRFLDFGF